jgi:hypothetical protein
MTSIKNIMLYIKRAEQHHTKEFITEAFSSNNIGKVRDVRFIKKNDICGREYNRVVVIFEHWNMNSLVKSLFDQMSTSKDGTTKFTYDYYSGRYWFINVYKPPQCSDLEYEEITTVDPSLSDKDRIKELEKLVKSMAVQMQYMQTRQEKTETQLMESEHNNTQIRLYNMELRCQVEEAQREKQWAEEELQEELSKIKEECDYLRCRNACLAVDLVRKQQECDNIKEELYDEKCVMNYVENQANDMRDMLKAAMMPKLTIEELM